MSTLRILSAILMADFRERTRRTSFLFTLCLVIYLGYAVNSGQILIKLGDARGVYNSAWVGSLMTLVITFFLGIAGFYLVKNAIVRDEQTGVGQIIASTPLSKPVYLMGKWLSNFTLLAALVGILGVAAVIMQVIQQEVAVMEIWTLVAPLILIALPMMALVAALAVFFESVDWLKGGFGNIAYFLVFIFLFSASIFLTDLPWLDVTGVSLISASMKSAASAVFPAYNGEFVLSMASDQPLQTFVWSGLSWSAPVVLQRIGWLVASLALVLMGALFFNRFDSRSMSKPLRQRRKTNENDLTEQTPVLIPVSIPRLTPCISPRTFQWNFLRLVWLEILLLMKGLKWYWLAGFAVLWVGSLVSPTESTRKFWFIAAAVWPVLVWSRMGERENRFQTEQLIFQCPFPVVRVLLAGWLAGISLSVVSLSGVLLGRLLAGEPLQLMAWCYGVLFIPTLALVMGGLSRSGKLFEVVYLILWYLGPLNKENGLAVIDYLGIHAGSPVYTQPAAFAGVILGMLFLAYIGRRVQLRSD